MVAITIPQNQNLYPTPNEHIKFDFENSIEEYRTARYLNNILKIFGKDAILLGLDLINITWTSIDEISLNFNEGTLIQDSTLIKLLYPFNKVLTNVTDHIKNNYYIIVFTDFNFIPVTSQVTSDPQNFLIRIKIYDPITKKVYTDNPDAIINIDNTQFINSTTSPNQYYLNTPIVEPLNLNYNNNPLLRNNVDINNLNENEWGIGDIDSIGENRIYIRLLDNVDPSTLNPDSLQYHIKQNIFNWNLDKNRIILHCAPLTSPYDNLFNIEIDDNIYISRGPIKDTTIFNYDIIEAFNLDGGLI